MPRAAASLFVYVDSKSQPYIVLTMPSTGCRTIIELDKDSAKSLADILAQAAETAHVNREIGSITPD